MKFYASLEKLAYEDDETAEDLPDTLPDDLK